ncbi:MAG TPA: hypothetical protein VGH77_13530 [Streptosporangiaceae bacterium]|jgi:hypothetical protein
MTMTIPAISGLRQPIALTRRPAITQNAQFGEAPPGIAGDQSAYVTEVHTTGAPSRSTAGAWGESG